MNENNHQHHHPSSSFAASVVGRKISILCRHRRPANKKEGPATSGGSSASLPSIGLIIGYNPRTQQHTVRLLSSSVAATSNEDEEEFVWSLNQLHFRWITTTDTSSVTTPKCSNDNATSNSKQTNSVTDKFRGVYWHENAQRWKARYFSGGATSDRGKQTTTARTINATTQKRGKSLGSFLEAKQAALAIDAELRRQGRPTSELNFPKEHPPQSLIDSWKTTQYRMIQLGPKQLNPTSQYRGVGYEKRIGKYRVQIKLRQVLNAMGRTKGGLHGGYFTSDIQAALRYDQICRRYGICETELNFPRNEPLIEVRLWDCECYLCRLENTPVNPVASRCNHIFCHECIIQWLLRAKTSSCPCCLTPLHHNETTSKDLRPITLIPWPETKKKKTMMMEKKATKRNTKKTNSNPKPSFVGQDSKPSSQKNNSSRKGKRTTNEREEDSSDDDDDDGDAEVEQFSPPQKKARLRITIRLPTKGLLQDNEEETG